MTVVTSALDRAIFSQAYAAGLCEYASGSGEAALKVAYELGQKAFHGDIGIVELAMMHHEVLGEMLLHDPPASERITAQAAQFFAEAISTFVTERKNAAEEVRRAKEAAEAANQELESFSYSVAHDLRAPLRSIQGFSHALLEDCGDRLGVEGKEHLELVIDSARHMGHLIDDLLALSRVFRGELRKERVDLSDVARKIAHQLQANESGRQVHFKIHDDMVDEADPHLLRAMLENLIGNAWKFTNKKPAAEIEFGVEPGSSPKTYFVADNGAGFNMAYADKLFGVFQRLHSVEEFEGTGIGLATVKKIVKRHGGKVWAKGRVGQGASFYFTLQGEDWGIG